MAFMSLSTYTGLAGQAGQIESLRWESSMHPSESIKNFQTEAEMQVYFVERFPAGTHAETILNELEADGFDCFHDPSQQLICRLRVRGRLFIHTVWIATFRLDDIDCVSTVMVKKGLMGL